MSNRGTSLSINFASRILEFSFLPLQSSVHDWFYQVPPQQPSVLHRFTNERWVVRYLVLEDQP